MLKVGPGDLPNLLYDLRRYLQVEPDDEKVEEELASPKGSGKTG